MEEGKAKERALTGKERRFVEEYCACFNATKAAIRAGYSELSARQIGSENLSKPYISKAIKERMEALSMPAEEGIKRLTDMGRASFEQFLRLSESGTIEINLASEEAKDNLHLIKKVKQQKRVVTTDTAVMVTITYEVELHDAKDAIKTLLEVQGKFGGLKEDIVVNISF